MKMIGDQPIPQGKYLPAVRNDDTIYTSGMTPRVAGKLQYEGPIRRSSPIEDYRSAVELATLNTIVAAQACLQKGEKIAQVLQLSVFLNAEDGFTEHSKIADFASDYLIEKLGANCIGSRAAIGVASLPSNAPVEITLLVKVTE